MTQLKYLLYNHKDCYTKKITLTDIIIESAKENDYLGIIGLFEQLKKMEITEEYLPSKGYFYSLALPTGKLFFKEKEFKKMKEEADGLIYHPATMNWIKKGIK